VTPQDEPMLSLIWLLFFLGPNLTFYVDTWMDIKLEGWLEVQTNLPITRFFLRGGRYSTYVNIRYIFYTVLVFLCRNGLSFWKETYFFSFRGYLLDYTLASYMSCPTEAIFIRFGYSGASTIGTGGEGVFFYPNTWVWHYSLRTECY